MKIRVVQLYHSFPHPTQYVSFFLLFFEISHFLRRHFKMLDFNGMCVKLLWSNRKRFLRLYLGYKHQTRQGVIKNGRRSSCEVSMNYVYPAKSRLEFIEKILLAILNMKMHENPSLDVLTVLCRQTCGRTDG